MTLTSTLASLVPSWVPLDFFDPNSPRLGILIGGACCGRGIRSFLQPGRMYWEYGIPREGSNNAKSRDDGQVSNLIYVQGIRDLAYALTLYAFGAVHNEQAVTIMLIAGAGISLGDAVVVWIFGRRNYQMVLWHFFCFTYFASLAGLRYYSLGDMGKGGQCILDKGEVNGRKYTVMVDQT
ncbi:hypothetical protein BDV19DRAFT_394379 [Aspergillus venezuelensis]